MAGSPVVAMRRAVEKGDHRSTPKQAKKARLLVAANSRDAADARELLEALGLIEPAPIGGDS